MICERNMSKSRPRWFETLLMNRLTRSCTLQVLTAYRTLTYHCSSILQRSNLHANWEFRQEYTMFSSLFTRHVIVIILRAQYYSFKHESLYYFNNFPCLINTNFNPPGILSNIIRYDVI